MGETTLSIDIDGTPVAAARMPDVVDVQVEESAREADAAVLTATLAPSGDRWTSVLDALATPRTPLAVTVTRGQSTYRFDGRSTEAGWSFQPDGASRMTAKAVDRTVEMNVEERIVDWSGNSDSQIADAILSRHGFTTAVQATPDRPDPDVHVVIQRATDWQFLRSLAARWGYEVYLETRGDRPVGVFGPLDPTAQPQGDLDLGFADPGARASVRAELLAGRSVHGRRLAALSDQVLVGDDPGTAAAQGAQTLGGQVSVMLAPTDVEGELDPADATKGLARRSAFGLRLDADVDTDRVDRLYRARRTVTVRGLGGGLSGLWLVESVRHQITRDGHRQRLQLARNAYGAGAPAL